MRMQKDVCFRLHVQSEAHQKLMKPMIITNPTAGDKFMYVTRIYQEIQIGCNSTILHQCLAMAVTELYSLYIGRYQGRN